jgi:hypothetical protein
MVVGITHLKNANYVCRSSDGTCLNLDLNLNLQPRPG